MTDSYLYLLIKAVITLVFVLGLMIAALYALRYFTGGGARFNGSRGRNPVRVISTIFLGQKRNLAVVDVAGELILIGITPGAINLLTRIKRPEAIEEIKKITETKTRTRTILNFFQ